MDLCFGEILIDQNSRAFYDDYDDLSQNTNIDISSIKWNWQSDGITNVPKNINRFIVIEGLNSQTIVQTYVQNVKNIKPLCAFRSMSLYQLENDILCVVEESDLSYYSCMSTLTEEFLKNAKECIIVSLQSLSDYKSSERPEGCLILGMNNSSLNDIPSLKAPNFITGISAGVASLRVLNDLTFTCYVIYVDYYDEHAIKIIVNHLKRINLVCDESAKIKPLHHKSDLYM